MKAIQLSLGELVRMLAGERASPQESRRAMIRLQGFTQAGLLRPVNADEVVRGRDRLYDVNTVFKAAVLYQLTEIDLPPRQLRTVANLIDELDLATPLRGALAERASRHAAGRMKKERLEWENAKKAPRDLFLGLTPQRDTTEQAFELGFRAHPMSSDHHPVTINVNIGQVFTAVREALGRLADASSK